MRTRTKLTMRLMALLLTAVMAVSPAFTAYASQDISSAANILEIQADADGSAVSDNMSEDAFREEAADGTVSDNNQTDNDTSDNDTSESDTSEGDISESDTSEGGASDDSTVSDNIIDEDEIGDGTLSGNAVSENTVSENTVSENSVSANETGVLFPGMPESYMLTSAQKAGKEELAACLGEIGTLEEGTHYVPGELVYSTDSEEEAQTAADAYGGELLSYAEGVAVIRLSKNVTVSRALQAAAEASVKLPAVWPNYYRYPFAEDTAYAEEIIEEAGAEIQPAGYGINDPFLQVDNSSYQWQHYAVGSMYAWNAGYRGQGITVAVIDSGIDETHTELKGRIAGQYDAISLLEGSAPDEASGTGHGSHVAGIIAAEGNNGNGGSGIAPEADIYAIKVFGSKAGSGSSAAVTRAINHAVEKNVDVINMSLGGFGTAALWEPEAIAVRAAVDKGIAVFVATGNDGAKTKCYPAAVPEAIAVSAVDKNNARAHFSNYGSWVDLCGPGVEIYSTLPPQVTVSGTVQNTNGYGAMSGTSQATPVVAGTAALILSANPKALLGKTGRAKVAALEQLMKASVTKPSGSAIGAGIPNLPKALKIPGVAAKPAKPLFDIPGKTVTDKEITIEIRAAIDCDIYYSTDGRTPTMKNGAVINAVKAPSNPYSVTVDGIVNDKVTGKATVKAMAVNRYTSLAGPVASAAYTFKPKVEKVTITGDTGAIGRLPAGKSLALKALVEPAYAANKAVKWSISGDTKVTKVSVTTSGVVKAGKDAVSGTYTVTAEPKDGYGGTPGSYTVIVADADKQDTLIKSIQFKVKKVPLQMQYTATDYDMADNILALKKDGSPAAAGDFIWSSSKKNVATVEPATGMVTTVAAGSTVITALAADGSGVKKTCTVTVEQLPTDMRITQPVNKENNVMVLLAAGRSATLKANVLPAATKNKAVTWTISGDTAETGVSVSLTGGKVTAKKTAKPGRYTVTATSKRDNSIVKTIDITVYEGAATKVTLDKKAVTLFRDTATYGAPQTAELIVTTEGTGIYAADYTVTSSNENIVKATRGGNVITLQATGQATGTSTIKVIMNDGSGKSATCRVTVVNPVSRLSIAPEAGRTNKIGEGKTLKLSAVYEEEFGKANKKVNWSVRSGKEFAKVDKNGKVTALQGMDKSVSVRPIPGVAVIQAEAADGSGVTALYTVLTYEAVVDMMCSYPEGSDIAGASDIIIYYNYNFFDGEDSWKSTGVSPEISLEVSHPDKLAVIKRTPGKFSYVPLQSGTVTVTIKAMDGSGVTEKRLINIRK